MTCQRGLTGMVAQKYAFDDKCNLNVSKFRRSTRKPHQNKPYSRIVVVGQILTEPKWNYLSETTSTNAIETRECMICQLGKISQVVVVPAAVVAVVATVVIVVVVALAVAVNVDAVAIAVVVDVDIVKATSFLHNYFVFLSLTTGRNVIS